LTSLFRTYGKMLIDTGKKVNKALSFLAALFGIRIAELVEAVPGG
jgi:hypothetical protein